MKVGVDLRCLQEAQGSGVATYTRLMLQALQQEPSLTLHGFTSGRRAPTSVPVSDAHHRSEPNLLLNARWALQRGPTLRKCFPDVSVVWQPNPLFVAMPHSQTLVVTIHDLSFVHAPQWYPRHTRWWYLRFVRQLLERAPERVELVAISRHTAADILETFPAWQGRVTTVSAPPPPLPVISVSPSKKRPYVLMVGTLEPRKNIEAAIRGFVRNRQTADALELVIVGRDAWRYRRRIAELAGQFRDRIHVVSYVSAAERERLYAEAWALVYPSYYEGFGYPPLEAFGYGVPVIASGVTSLPHVLGDAALYVDPFTASESVATHLAQLLQSPTLYRTMQERGRARLQQLHKTFSIQPLLDLWQRCA